MRSKLQAFPAVILLICLGLAACAPQSPCPTLPAETVEIATAKLIIEYNAVADDLGVHGAFDDHGWANLCVFDPNGNVVLFVGPQAQLGDLTMAGIFFESREPPLNEFTFENLAATFPEGQYEVRAINFDGTGLVGEATFTHNVPAKPVVLNPVVTPDEEQAGEFPVSIADLVITWEPVVETVDGQPVEITGYEVIVTKLDHDDPNGFSLPVYDVHVSPEQTSLHVPAEFFEPGAGYELEVLALEVSGNQTIAGGYFTAE